MKLVLILGVVLFPSLCVADVLSTTSPNNGSGGIFMDFTAGGTALSITSFETYLSASAGISASIEVYTRPGGYSGFDASSAGWTLTETASATSAGSGSLASILLNLPISIGAGDTVAVYLHSITSGNGIRYNGTSSNPPQTTWSDANLTLFSDRSRTGNVAFSGSTFSPRTFAGNVHYTLDASQVPEPSSFALIGLGIACLALRRRNTA